MLCFGHPAVARAQVPRYEGNVVHRNTYERMDGPALRAFSETLDAMFASRGLKPGTENVAQDVYARKYAADFTLEMNRSVRVWLERWQTAEK
jgi:FMN reductase (NADPH)/FMN reductase [NAD(P)H]